MADKKQEDAPAPVEDKLTPEERKAAAFAADEAAKREKLARKAEAARFVSVKHDD